MPQSLSAVYLHLIFSTKNRMPFLKDRDVRSEVHAYLSGISRNLDCPAILVGGVADHVHILARQSPVRNLFEVAGNEPPIPGVALLRRRHPGL